ncbi:MAG: sulfate adenylyltransferase subunit CysD [Burkholderiales bacterium]|nr:sulfate adenylyltransferase subunit CysD [Burkholderiales bacterium]
MLLRLQGEKLAVVTDSTGLSAPTVIAAVKAYRQGGWEAVEVRPRRGRPPVDEQGIAEPLQARLLAAMQAGAPAGHPLWTRQAVLEWLAANGCVRSAGVVARWCEAHGLGGEDIPESERSDGVLRLHGAERAGFICVKAPRGKLLWVAFGGKLEARHYIALLDQLAPPKGTRIELKIAGSSRLVRVPQLRDWLQAHSDRLTLADPEIGSPATVRESPIISPPQRTSMTTLTHLQRLEAESIHIMREVVAEADKPVMLYSIGKDSAVMLHLAMKAFYPSKPPFPLLHVDTRWKFKDMYAFRDRMVKELGLDLITHVNPEGLAKGINPFTHGSAIHTDVMKTEGLKQALDQFGFDAAFGGARRDEEKSRAKERIFSFRSAQHRWDPKNQRPELWKLYNARKHKGESLRIFPLSNWTELDVWQYIYLNNIPIVPLYYAAERPVVERGGTLIMVDDERMPLNDGEVPMMKKVRFRTLGCYPLTGAVESNADTLPQIIQEMLLATTSERQGRVIDHDSAASMEKKKQEGYF